MRRWCVLGLLCSMALTADALSLYDPKLCFILDGFLGLYGLFITAMFLKEKFCRPKVKSEENPYASLRNHDKGGGYGELRRDPERGRTPRGHDDTYTGLIKHGEDSEYRELPKREQRQRKNEQVYQGLSSATRDTYDSLQMQQFSSR